MLEGRYYVVTHCLLTSLLILTDDEDMLEVVGLEPNVDGLARETTVGEGEPG